MAKMVSIAIEAPLSSSERTSGLSSRSPASRSFARLASGPVPGSARAVGDGHSARAAAIECTLADAVAAANRIAAIRRLDHLGTHDAYAPRILLSKSFIRIRPAMDSAKTNAETAAFPHAYRCARFALPGKRVYPAPGRQ